MGDEQMWAEQSNSKVEQYDGVQARVWEWVSTYGPAVTALCRASGSLLPGVGGMSLSTGPVGPGTEGPVRQRRHQFFDRVQPEHDGRGALS
jgi:hypothetical protein